MVRPTVRTGARKVPTVRHVPGMRALAFVSRWFDPVTVATVFEPLIADWQEQWRHATPSARPGIRVRGLAALLATIVVAAPRALSVRTPPALVRRVAFRIVMFVAVASSVLTMPFVSYFPHAGARGAWLLLALLPSSIALSFPFSMLIAAEAVYRDRTVPPFASRWTLLKLAVASTSFMLLMISFVTPAANQEYRRAATRLVDPAGAAPMRGVRELSSYELITSPRMNWSATRHTSGGDVRREVNNRAMLMVLPAALVWLHWNSRHVRHRRKLWPIPAWAMTILVFAGFFVSYWLAPLIEDTWGLRAGTGLWLPIVVAALLGVMPLLLTSRREAAV